MGEPKKIIESKTFHGRDFFDSSTAIALQKGYLRFIRVYVFVPEFCDDVAGSFPTPHSVLFPEEVNKHNEGSVNVYFIHSLFLLLLFHSKERRDTEEAITIETTIISLILFAIVVAFTDALGFTFPY